ncbi:MAG: glycosyltransferase family 39 protein [Candidatus Omnitrophica bacterium]|nr:glycosyltransferase family 39 protein [Candidatus Omnitrophota bacterium]
MLKLNKKAGPLLLFFIIIFAFVLRIYGISKLPALTTDGYMYMKIAQGVYENPLNYSSRNFHDKFTAEGRRLPDFINRPLFVYPPVFCYLIALMYFLWGVATESAMLVPLFFGLGTIIVTFFIAKNLYNKNIAILSALFVSIEPINWLCSQKVWIETAYTFFSSLAILFFINTKRSRKYFVFAGISLGIALLSKYQAILTLFVIIGFMLLRKRKLLLQKDFLFFLASIGLLFLPWIIWNALIDKFQTLRGFVIANITRPFEAFSLVVIIFSSVLAIALILRKALLSLKDKGHQTYNLGRLKKLIVVFSCSLAVLFLVRYILPIVFSFTIPKSGWYQGIFRGEPPYFYLKRLIEFSPLYLFSYIAIIYYYFKKGEEDFLLILWAVVILAFHILWGNYQSRYIILSIPPLLILASKLCHDLYNRITKIDAVKVRITYEIIFILILLFSVFKTFWVGGILATTSQPCYF